LSEVSNFPELPVVPSTDFTRKEGRSRSAASAVNFHNIGAFNGGELSQQNSLDQSAVNSKIELQCNPTEETDLKQRIQNPELSASAAEFIPRPVRDRKMSTKFDDYEVKFVRTMRAKRLHSSGISPSKGNRKNRIIWNSDYTATEPESVRLNAKRLTPYVPILQQNRIQIAMRTDSQSEAEPGSQQQSPIIQATAARPKKLGCPWIRPAFLFSKTVHGLCSDGPCYCSGQI